MESIGIKDEFIKLGQALKLAGLVDSGIEAKLVIQEGKVKVDGNVEERRGRKLYDGMVVEYAGNSFQVKSSVHQ